MRKGFTLVELSIVLVIIGLLIGGILVAQSMIQTVKIHRFVNQLNQYEIAVNNFVIKFKNYPGDSPLFTPPGNGDDTLVYGAAGATACADPPNNNLSNTESFQVWAHLSESEMLSTYYPAFSPDATWGNCGGSMTIDEFQIGKYTPYTEYDNEAAAAIGRSRDFVRTNKDSELEYFNFYFILNNEMVIPIESKLGSKDYVFEARKAGLSNNYGVGNCADSTFSLPVPCMDTSAVFGVLIYYLAPIN